MSELGVARQQLLGEESLSHQQCQSSARQNSLCLREVGVLGDCAIEGLEKRFEDSICSADLKQEKVSFGKLHSPPMIED